MLWFPRKGFSQLDRQGGPFWNPAADEALLQALKENLGPAIPLIEVEAHINDGEFAERAATALLEMVGKG